MTRRQMWKKQINNNHYPTMLDREVKIIETKVTEPNILISF